MTYILNIVILIVSLTTWQAQAETKHLGSESLGNHKTLMVQAGPGMPNGLAIQVTAQYRGEPAMSPVYLTPLIKCSETSSFKTMDLARDLGGVLPDLVGAATKKYPNGQIHVCAFESINFDNREIKMSFYQAGPNGCDLKEVTEVFLPISHFCD